MKVRIRVIIPRWVVLYGRALVFFGETFDVQPDTKKYCKLIKRFSKYEVIDYE